MTEMGRSNLFSDISIEDILVDDLEKALNDYLTKTVQISPIKARAAAGRMARGIVSYARSCNQHHLVMDMERRLSLYAPSADEKTWLTNAVDMLHGSPVAQAQGQELWHFLLERVLGIPPAKGEAQ